MDLGSSAARAAALAFILAACAGNGSGPETHSLAERLQGSWACGLETKAGEFLRSDIATLEANKTSIRYSWNVLWDCAKDPCAEPAPKDRGGYFEGVFRELGDSLALQDGVDTVAFRDVGDSTFDFVVNGAAFPMRRR